LWQVEFTCSFPHEIASFKLFYFFLLRSVLERAKRAKLDEVKEIATGLKPGTVLASSSEGHPTEEKKTPAPPLPPTNEGEKSAEDTKKAPEEDPKNKSEEKPSAENKAREEVTLEVGTQTFPEKLYQLLQGDEMKDSMWWLPDGDAFCLVPMLFAHKVLDRHFQGTKLESFTRKLNRWGFKRVAGQKVPSDAVAYYHTDFQRGKPELLKDMSGGKNKNLSREKKQPSPAQRELSQLLLASQQRGAALSGGHRGLGATGGIGGGGNLLDLLSRQAHASDQDTEAQSLMASGYWPTERALQQRVKQALLEEHRQKEAAREAILMRLLQGQGGVSGAPQAQDDLVTTLLLANAAPSGNTLESFLLPQHMPSANQGAADLTTRLLAQRIGANSEEQSLDTSSRLLAERLAASEQIGSSSDATARLLAQRLGAANQFSTDSLLAHRTVAPVDSSSGVTARWLAEARMAGIPGISSTDLRTRALLAASQGGASLPSQPAMDQQQQLLLQFLLEQQRQGRL
jgi:hypothetical protein